VQARVGLVRARIRLGLVALAIALHGCAPSVPRIRLPDRIEPFCGSKQARTTSVASTITSTSDQVASDRPNETGIRRELAAAGGVIEHWDPPQLLKLPNTSVQLGESDGFARVEAAAIPIVSGDAQSRTIYLHVQDHGAPRWIALQAYDVQNVCVEGRREG
jgi:hypothetical protein